MEILRAARPGVSERETFVGVPWGGEPLSYHPVSRLGRRRRGRAAEPDVAACSSSATRRSPAIGLWGGNCARGGLVAAAEARIWARRATGYLDGLAMPYWRAMATWYESPRARRRSGGDVFEEITALLEGEAFASSLNPGHLIHYEEWLDSPIRAGSSDPIASGMVFQSDIIPTGIRARLDGELRGHRCDRRTRRSGRRSSRGTRSCGRGSRARRAFLRDRLGVEVRDEVLPLTPTPCYFPPFWLDLDKALVFA